MMKKMIMIMKKKKSNKTKEARTTIVLFIEFLNFKLKDCLSNNIISNTMKVKIAMEDAFDMFYILSFGMIHHDLKI